MNNALKYAGASQINLNIFFAKDKVRLNIKDNSIGFYMPDYESLINKKKFGLIGIVERSRLIGGIMDINSLPGRGTVVNIEVPANSLHRAP